MKYFTIICLALSVASCISNTPYEVRSPCVAIEAHDSNILMPCIRRPVNLNHDFA